MKENARYITDRLESLAINKLYYQNLPKFNKQISEDQAKKMCLYYDNATKLVMDYAGTDVLIRVQTLLQEDIEFSKHKKDISDTYQELLFTITNYVSKEKNKNELEK